MARFLYHADPALLRPNGALGDFVTVVEDGAELGALDVIDFGVLDVPGMTVAEGQEFLRSGVPQALIDAERSAMADFIAAQARANAPVRQARRAVDEAPDLAARLVAEAALAEAEAARVKAQPEIDGLDQAARDAAAAAHPSLFPKRARRLDVTRLPKETTIDRVAASRAAIEANRAAAEAEGTRRAAAAEETLRLPGEEALPIGEVAALRFAEALAVGARSEQIAAIDAARDAADAKRREGERSILDPVLAALPRPEVVVWTRSEFDAALVRNG